jgi:two-component system response regulator LytT
MNILIIEDEARIASRIERMVTELLKKKLTSISICSELDEGRAYIKDHQIDLLFLDLNLNGENGFDVLKTFSAASFHTIIISAYQEKAIQAFEYGVIDFIAKPFDQERLAQALARINSKTNKAELPLKFLAVRIKSTLQLIDIQDVIYFKGAGIYAEIHLKDGRTFLHDKTLEKLGQLLNGPFERIHKSYLVCTSEMDKIVFQSGQPHIELKNGEKLPIGRTRYEMLKERWLS